MIIPLADWLHIWTLRSHGVLIVLSPHSSLTYGLTVSPPLPGGYQSVPSNVIYSCRYTSRAKSFF
ncbi:hypothetical protein M758_2G015300 [Ceratodon purpureus]|nr:hypothetical protein M758_2G015300 [Ceratodon purpureus]